ncbi:MAG: hypothetical protein ACRCTZ_07885 [Sarcina sp.]
MDKLLTLTSYEIKGNAEDIIDFLFEGRRFYQSIMLLGTTNERCKITYDKDSIISTLNKIVGIPIKAVGVTTKFKYSEKEELCTGTLEVIFKHTNGHCDEILFNVESKDKIEKAAEGLPIAEQRFIPDGLLETMVGKDKAEVRAKLRELDFDCETVEEDSISYICTCDIRTDRARMRVKEGKVIAIWVE